MAKQMSARQRAALWGWEMGAGGLRSDLRQLTLQTESKAGISAESPGFLIDTGRIGTPRPVQPGRCVNFDGVDDYIDLSAVTGVGRASPYTFCAWVKPNAISAAAKPVWMHANSTSDRNGVSIENSSIYCGSYNGSTYDGKVASGITTAWQHVVYVRVDGGAGDKIFINGIEATYTGGTVYNLSATEKVLGKTANGSTFFPGKMFDARIYNRALTALEIANIYATSKPGGRPGTALYPSSLVGHWKLDAPINAATGYGPGVMWDSSGNGYHGAAFGHAASFYYSGADVPFSWDNEVGYTPISASTNPNWTALMDGWGATTWTAAGTDAKATALTAQSWAGRTGLRAAKFTNGAIGAYADNRVVTNTVGFTVPADKGAIVEADIALSRPLAVGESLRIYFVGIATGSVIDLTSTSGVGTKFTRCIGSIHSRNPSYADSLFAVIPTAGVTGGDITVYIDNLKYWNTNITVPDGTWLDSKWWTDVIPQNSAVPSKDVLGNTLTYTGECPRNAKLIDSYCGTFDGADDVGTCGAASIANGATVLTASAWVYRAASGAYQGIVGDWGADPLKKWMLYINAANGIRARVSANGINSRARDSNVILPLNEWSHVAMVYSGGEIAIYINGVESATTLADATAAAAVSNAATVTRLGTSSAEVLNGKLCDVRIYSAALTAGDIALIYAGKEPATSPVGHWPLAEGSGAILYDVSGNGLHATLTGATLATFWGTRQSNVHRNIRRGFRVANATGAARTFNGTDQAFTIADNVSLTNTGDNLFWACGWFKVSAISAPNKVIAGQWEGSGNVRSWLLYVANDDLIFGVSGDGAGSSSPTVSNGVAADTWIFGFGYHDPTANVVGCAQNGGAFTLIAHATGIFNSTANVTVGARGNTLIDWLPGEIGLVAVGKPSGSPDWAAIRDAIYNGGTPLTYSQLTATQKTDWGLVSWWDCDEYENKLRDKHGTNHLTAVGCPYIPAKADGLLAADGSAITNAAGVFHNAAETRIDFKGGVAASPWCDDARTGYTIPTAYNFGDALPHADMTKRAVLVPSGRESHFQIK